MAFTNRKRKRNRFTQQAFYIMQNTSTEEDIYHTIETAVSNILFKDKNSKFIGYAYPITSENEVKPIIEQLKKEHFNARHWCYAYQIGTTLKKYRANDDGEPNNSAGTPIYGQIQSFNLTNILIIVVRYFGGTKLGVSGLINAYKTCAELTINESTIIERNIQTLFQIDFEYPLMNKVMRVIKENNLEIINQTMELKCVFIIATRKSNTEKINEILRNFFGITYKQLK